MAGGSLYPGDKIRVTVGDTSGGGAGFRAQTFREKEMVWRIYVDPFGTEVYSLLDPSPTQTIVGGGLHRLVVVAPTTVRPNEPFEALVKAEDGWGNPCERYAGRVELSAEVADGEYSVILDQVTNGVAVRMAVLYLLLGAKGKPAEDN